MDQKQRDKIVSVLAVVLGLILVYVVFNAFQGRKKNPPPPPPATTMVQSVPVLSVEQIKSPALDSTLGGALDPKVLAEQQQIAARLPRRNPFDVAEAGRQMPDDRRRIPESVQGAVNNEIKPKVAAIVSRPGSNKRIAMINGKMLEEGDRIGEWTILAVNPKNVVLGNGTRQMVVGVK